MAEVGTKQDAACKTCGKRFTFTVVRRHKIYCGPKCYPYQIRKHPQNVLKKCAFCGRSFEDNSRGKGFRYCSNQCKNQARRQNPIDKEKRLARGRLWYREKGGREKLAEYNRQPDVMARRRLQTRLYKARHPEKVAEFDKSYRSKRNERIAKQSDGTAGGMIARLMKLKHCQYCGHRFASEAEKRIDHRDPVAYGGQHSAANVELCCDRCNSRKAAMPFVEWVATLSEPHKPKAIARAEKARGAPLTQQALPLFGGAIVKPKKDKGIDPVLAKREAIAAWKQWIHELAPSEWLDGYYGATGKPWTDHRLTDALAFGVRYRCDPAFKRKWLDARNKRRAIRRIDDPSYDKPRRRDDRTLPMWGNCG